MSEDNALLIVNIEGKLFDNTVVFSNLQFSIKEHEIISIFGPSGCGKTTLLRMIAGLEETAKNEIILSNILPENVGFIFQKPVLYPHLNVAKNILLGSPVKLTKQQQSATVDDSLELVGLPGFGNRKVTTLSGGEAQRVVLARALLAKPKLLLLDEPFSSLDLDSRRQLATEVKNILKDQNVAAIHVSHDIEEAKIISDRILHWGNISEPSSASNNNEDVQR